MQVETYEVQPEIDAEGQSIECDAEALELIEQLGLEGQQKLLSSSDEGESQRVPYRKMTEEEALVYGALFKQKTPLRKYGDEPVPLRVLQVAAHAKGLFDEIEVWHAPNADIDDPILVGRNGDYYSSRQERFMLARWGTALAPLAELKKAAGRVKRNELQELAADIRSRVDAFAAKVEACRSDEAVLGFSVPKYFD